jgi:hypothetical protein
MINLKYHLLIEMLLLNPVKLYDALSTLRNRLHALYVDTNDIGVANTIYAEVNYITHIMTQIEVVMKA